MQYSVYAVLGVCHTRCLLVIMAWRDSKRRLNFIFSGDGRVEDENEKAQSIWGNHHRKLGLKRISCASLFTIPDTACTTPDTGCHYIDTRSSQHNQASRTPDFSYPLVSSTSFSYSSPISLFLVHNSIIIAETKVKSSLSNSLSHDHELTVSTAYAKYSIHRVQYT